MWPKMGFSRFFKYILIKVKRMPGRPHFIAAGVACGVFASFTPLVGVHLIFSAVFAFIFKGSIIASFIGTAVGNPWTFPIIWFASYRLGLFFMGIYQQEMQIQSVNFIHLFQNFFGALIQLDFEKFKLEILPLWLPMLIGSIPLGLLAGLCTYFPLKKMIATYQEHREKSLARRQLGFSRKKELKNKLQNFYKKIKRIVRNKRKTKWQKAIKNKAYIRKIVRKVRHIANKKYFYLNNYVKKSLKARLAKRFKQSLQTIKSGRKNKRFKNRISIKKLRRLSK